MAIEEVRALVAERQRYDDWLSALSARLGDTPSHVFDRVKADYAARRDGVTTSLHGHVESLTGMRDGLDTRVAELSDRLSTLRDDRAEAMLRNAVGEYDAAKWDTIRQTVETQIGDLESQRAALEEELREVQTLLGHASEGLPGFEAPELVSDSVVGDQPSVAASASPSEATVPAWEAEAAVDPVPHLDAPVADDGWLVVADESFAPSSDALPTDAAVEERSSPSELPFLDTGLEDQNVVAPGSDATAHGDELDELAFLRDGASGTTSQTADVAVPDVPQIAAPDVPAPAATSGGDPRKTLRCAECGTMNLPTEWYCERCGGELSAY